jgi:hypothetical protein
MNQMRCIYCIVHLVSLLVLTGCATAGAALTLGVSNHSARQFQPKQELPGSDRSHAGTLQLLLASSDGAISSGAARAPRIGWVYRIEGYLDGKPVRYVGSAADLKDRLSRRKHQWSILLRQESTSVYAVEVFGDLNIQDSNRKTAWSARNEALRAAEQRVLDQLEKDVERTNQHKGSGAKDIVILNKDKASVNTVVWEARHKVSVGNQWRLLPRRIPGVTPKVIGMLALLDAFLIYRDSKMSQAAWAPYVLEDEKGIFILQYRESLLSSEYFKTYIDGESAGQQVDLAFPEFSGLREEAEALWGTTDWKGDFVPGLLLRELPVITTEENGRL